VLEVKCPNCSLRLKLPDGALGKRVKCSSCEHSFVAEASQPGGLEEIVDLQPTPASDMPPRNFPAKRVNRSSAGLRGIFVIVVAAIGAVFLAIGLFAMLAALGMETTVDASHNERGLLVENRVHNQGLMHKREIDVVVSGTAILSGILMIGFASLHPPLASRAE
jgi:LSD1 subclass zinc finger protein